MFQIVSLLISMGTSNVHKKGVKGVSVAFQHEIRDQILVSRLLFDPKYLHVLKGKRALKVSVAHETREPKDGYIYPAYWVTQNIPKYAVFPGTHFAENQRFIWTPSKWGSETPRGGPKEVPPEGCKKRPNYGQGSSTDRESGQETAGFQDYKNCRQISC